MSTDDALGTLRRMVEIPSVTGQEAALARYLAGRMTELGYAARIDGAGNAVGEIGAGHGPVIMLVGHLDTVPGSPPVRQVGDRLYGRGTVDAKGPLAAMVHAGSRAAAEAGARVVVVGAVEEEGSSRGARHLLRSAPPDALVIGEPSGAGAVAIGYKGLLRVECLVRRPPSHATSPEEKAVEVAVDLVRAVRERLAGNHPAQGPLFERAVPVLVRLEGDLASARAELDCRVPEGFDAPEFLEWLRGLSDGTTVKVLEHVPAVRTGRTDPVVRALSAAIRREGRVPGAKVKLGTSDMNVLAPAWQVPMAAYGPGDSRLDHTETEHIVLGEYLFAVDVLAAALPEISAALAVRPERGRTDRHAADRRAGLADTRGGEAAAR
ncbi:M20/M25/M40 family metallo-hydrolase [Nonomuraea fuscirosea]|uniref:M20/M25/M40 family metallo-hydrolase n=1 Tax=Nonomuraea fuscirosea TaxID=1291556 RepID=UPI00343D9D9F